jgi:type I restriction enzyme S subunit
VTPADLGQLKTTHVQDSRRHLTRLGFQNASIEMLPVNSVILSSRAPIGYLAINDVPVCTNQGCKSFVPGASLDARYLFHFLKRAVPSLRELGSGATFAEVSKSKLEGYAIPLPPLAEQQRIVAKLDEQMAALDHAEKALAEQQAAASAVATAVLQQAFSGPECKRWPSVRLVRAGTFDAGGTPAKDQQRYWSDTGYPFVTGADITSATVGARNARAFLTQEGLVSGKTAVCPAGTVLVVTRTRVGRVGIAGETVAVSQDITAFTCQRNLLPTYVMWFLRKESDHLIAQSRGATIQGLRRSILEDLDIPVPSIPEQRQIAESIEQATHNVAMLQQSITYQLGTLTSLRTSFLDAAFSGEI